MSQPELESYFKNTPQNLKDAEDEDPKNKENWYAPPHSEDDSMTQTPRMIQILRKMKTKIQILKRMKRKRKTQRIKKIGLPFPILKIMD